MKRGSANRIRVALIALLALGAPALGPSAANAATIVVDSATDDGLGCTLREAAESANADADTGGCLGIGPYGDDLILIESDGTISLAAGQIIVSDSVAIVGSGDVLLDAGGSSRVFLSDSGGGGALFQLRKLRIANGLAGYGGLIQVGSGDTLRIDSCILSGGSADRGGSVYINMGTLEVVNSEIASCQATEWGGGIYAFGSSVSITDSTLADNAAGDGGGVYVWGMGGATSSLSVGNSTFSGNSADGSGGGLYSNAATSLDQVTIAANSADHDVDETGNGGGIMVGGGTLSLHATILDGNQDTSVGTQHPDCSGSLESQDFNLIGDTAGCTIGGTATHDVLDQSAQLGTLGDNGGIGRTHVPAAGSPAVDAADPMGCPDYDQRGLPRPQDMGGGAICDMGAAEALPEYDKVTLLMPDGGEVVHAGSVPTIWWGAPQEATRFTLKFSKDGGKTWEVIERGVEGNSRTGAVDPFRRNSRRCLVKVIGRDDAGVKVGRDSSDEFFSVVMVEVTEPAGGDVLPAGNLRVVTWDTYATVKPVASVEILLTKNGGATWRMLDTLSGNPGYFEWYPSSTKQKTRCRVKVVLRNQGGRKVGADASDGWFTIQP